VGFGLMVLALLVLDLGVFHRHAHTVRWKEAIGWSASWIGLGLLFGLGVSVRFWPDVGLQYLTAYLIEKALSVDNLFVIAAVMGYFAVPSAYQHKVLFWGILGALVMRLAFILAGSHLLQRFHWVMYLFGAFLVFTGVRLLFQR